MSTIHFPWIVPRAGEDETRLAMERFGAGLRVTMVEQKQAVENARPALERLMEVMQCRSGQPYKLRALLYSLWNGKPASLVEIVCFDWQIRKDLLAVMLAFGAPEFFYKELQQALERVGQFQWFLEEAQ